MTKEECIALMKTAKDYADWRYLCDKVKEANGGDYPPYWYDTIIRSGLANEIMHDPHFTNLRMIPIKKGQESDLEATHRMDAESLLRKYGWDKPLD